MKIFVRLFVLIAVILYSEFSFSKTVIHGILAGGTMDEQPIFSSDWTKVDPICMGKRSEHCFPIKRCEFTYYISHLTYDKNTPIDKMLINFNKYPTAQASANLVLRQYDEKTGVYIYKFHFNDKFNFLDATFVDTGKKLTGQIGQIIFDNYGKEMVIKGQIKFAAQATENFLLSNIDNKEFEFRMHKNDVTLARLREIPVTIEIE